MSNTASASKVISINATSRERSPGQRLINECSDRLNDELCDWLAEIRAPISEEFFVLADSTRDRLLQTRYLDLRQDIDREWPRMIDAFRRAFATGMPTTAANPSPLEVPDFEGLQLVDDEELSERIVVREFSAQLTETCDEELYPLDRRIASLLGRDEPTDGENPLAPALICQALTDACASLGRDAEHRLLLMRRIERHLHQVLPSLYRDINNRLVERGILPDLKRTYRRTGATQPSSTNPGSGGSSGSMAGTEFAGAATGATLPGGADGIFGAMQRLAAARTVPFMPNGYLTEHNTPPAQGEPGSVNAASISHAFLASLNEVQHMEWQPMPGAAINQVRQVRESEAARQASPLESVTIDIVAMLFDFVFNDEQLPDSVKSLIGRLQIPVLKVAMLDQSFFANRQHPARRFLDSIAGVALHWGNASDENDPFHAKLAELVARIQEEFETNVEIFGEAITELEAFVTSREAEEESTVAVAADAVVRREAEDAAWERARAALQPVLEKAMPAPVQSFFTEQWARVLQHTALAHDVESAAWQDCVGVMTQLLESIEPKSEPDQRLHLISVLPTLLSRLNRGLDTIDSSAEDRRPFFDALVELHAGALKGAVAEAATTPASVSTPVEQGISEGDLLVTRSVADGIEIEEVMLVGATPMRRARDRDALAQVAALKRGDWVDFVDADGNVSRERLNWISPQKGIMVFSNHRAAKAISISPDALARQIRDGAIRVVEDTSPIERALDGVMRSLHVA